MVVIHAPGADKGRGKTHAATRISNKFFMTLCMLTVSRQKYEELSPPDKRRVDCKKCRKVLGLD